MDSMNIIHIDKSKEVLLLLFFLFFFFSFFFFLLSLLSFFPSLPLQKGMTVAKTFDESIYFLAMDGEDVTKWALSDEKEEVPEEEYL